MTSWMGAKDAARVLLGDADDPSSLEASADELVSAMKKEWAAGAPGQMADDIEALLDASVPLIRLAMQTVAATGEASRFTTVLRCAAMLLQHAAKMTTPIIVPKEGAP